MPMGLLAISVDGTDIARLARFLGRVLDRPANPGATLPPSIPPAASGSCSTRSRIAGHQVTHNRRHVRPALAHRSRQKWLR
jgi:hypothetical protein